MRASDATLKLLTGGLSGYAAGEIFTSLREYSRRTRRGHVLPPGVGFGVHVPDRKLLCPDIAFFLGELSMAFPEGSPALAVEVRNERDYGLEAEDHANDLRQTYFKAGTLVVWDVDLLSQQPVRVYRAARKGEKTTIYRWGQTAEAEPAVPGWTFTVDDLLP